MTVTPKENPQTLTTVTISIQPPCGAGPDNHPNKAKMDALGVNTDLTQADRTYRISTANTAPTSCQEGQTLGVPLSWANLVTTIDRQSLLIRYDEVNPQITQDSVNATSKKMISCTLPKFWIIPPFPRNRVPLTIHVPAARRKPRIVEMIHTFGNCHSTG